jgi:hypothetical protein
MSILRFESDDFRIRRRPVATRFPNTFLATIGALFPIMRCDGAVEAEVRSAPGGNHGGA